MEWRALPPLDWLIVIGGVLWSIFWVTAVCLLVWTLAHLRGWLRGLGAHTLQLAEPQYARGEISRERLEDGSRDLRDMSSPDR
jgi:uncharacterized membrane protein